MTEQLTFSQFSSHLATGDYAPVADAFAQYRSEDDAVDSAAIPSLLQTLSAALNLDLNGAQQFFVLGEAEAPGYSLAAVYEALQQFSDSQSPPEIAEPSTVPEQPKESPRSEQEAISSPHSPAAVSPTETVEETEEPQPAITVEEPTIPHEDGFDRIAEEVDAALSQLKEAETRSEVVAPMSTESDKEVLIKKLKNSIEDFEELQRSRELTGEDTAPLLPILKTLKTQLRKLTHGSSPEEKMMEEATFMEKCTRTIRRLFHFYSTQFFFLGKDPSFDLIQHNSQVWNISKFVRYCQDFSLLTDKRKRTPGKYLDFETVKAVFKRNAALQREMSEDQFLQALGNLADVYYSKNYDDANGTDVAAKTVEEKREMLYRYLRLHHTREAMKKAKGFGIPFHSRTDNRMPENDLALKYRYRPRKSPVLMHKKQQSEIPKEHTITSLSPAKKSSANANESDVVKRHDMTIMATLKAQQPFTLKSMQDLNALAAHSEEFDLSALIADDSSEDELLKKQYPLAASHPVLPRGKVKSPDKPLRPVLKKPPPKPLDLSQKTKELSLALIRKEKEKLNRSLKATEAQQERGNKVLDRLKLSSHF